MDSGRFKYIREGNGPNLPIKTFFKKDCGMAALLKENVSILSTYIFVCFLRFSTKGKSGSQHTRSI